MPDMKPLKDYTGRYQDSNQDFFVDVKFRDSTELQLEIAFQGFDCQMWALEHYQGDIFLCIHTSFSDLAKRAIFTFLDEDYFQLIFRQNESGEIDRLSWLHDEGVPAEEQFYMKTSVSHGYSIQRSVLKTL